MLKTIKKVSYMGTAFLLTASNTAFAACTAAEKAEGCVDLIAPAVDPVTGKNVTVANYIVSITNWVVALVGAIAVLFIIWAGIQYVTASGNKDQAEKAKKTLTYAVVGIIIVVLARVIVGLVFNTTDSIF